MLTYHQKIELIATTPELGPKGGKVWAILKAMLVEAWRAGRDEITPKNASLAIMAKCSVRTVQRVVLAFERAGLLSIGERYVVVDNRPLRISNRISVALIDVRARLMAAMQRGGRDKFVMPITRLLYSDRFKPSRNFKLPGRQGLRHNLR
jgi:hypothetical protein